VGAFGVPRGERLRRLPPPRAYPGGRLTLGAVPLDGRPGPSGASGGSGRGHHPLDVAPRTPGGLDRGAHRSARTPVADRAHGHGGAPRRDRSHDDLRAHGARDDRFAQCFAYGVSPGLAIFLCRSANAALIIARRPRPSSAYSPECVEGPFSELRAEGVLGSSHSTGPIPMGVPVQTACSVASVVDGRYGAATLRYVPR
jgi:hypothetical protein